MEKVNGEDCMEFILAVSVFIFCSITGVTTKGKGLHLELPEHLVGQEEKL